MPRVPKDDVSSLEARGSRPRFGRAGAGHEQRGALEVFPQELLRGLAQGRGILFVGPGISRAAGVALRQTLADAMRGELRQRIPLADADDLEAFLAQASPPEVAQALYDQIGRDAWLRFLHGHLASRDLPPPPLLYALRALPCRIVLTTNFDRLLERTWENPLEDTTELTAVIPKPEVKDPIPEPESRPVLVKLFGDLETPESLVLTTDDYEAFFRARPELVTRLKALLEAGPALFVGYHVRDPEFRRLYSQVGALIARAHRRAFAIMEGLSRFEVDWWAQRALTVLRAPTGDGTDATLRELKRQLQRQAHPGLEIEPELSPRGAGGAGWQLNPILEAQLESAGRTWLLPGPNGPIDPRTGYIPLGLVLEGPPGQSREDRLADLVAENRPDAPRHLRAPLALDAEAMLERSPRAVVLGPAGSGKTTLLLHLLQTRSEASLEKGDRTLLAFLPMRALAASPSLSLMECLVEHLISLVPNEPRETLETAIMDALIEGRALVLLDGLDAIEPDEEHGVLERISAFINDCPKVRLVITCRSGAWKPGALSAELELATYEISSLSPEQQNAFIRDRLRGKPAEAETLIALLRAGVVHWTGRLASNPLHLSLICLAWHESGQFPASRSALYASYLGSLLRRSRPGQENALYACDKELILQAIALHAMHHPRSPLTDELVYDLAEQELTRAHIAPRRDVERHSGGREVIEEIVEGSGILIGPNKNKVFEFRHSALREYLVARMLMSLEPGAQEILAQHAGNPRWAGVWRLMAAISEDATPLLEQLETSAQEPTRPVYRCFGEAHRVQPSWLKRRLGEHGATAELGLLLSRLKGQLSSQEALELFGEILWGDQEAFMREGRRSDTRAVYIALNGLQRMIEEEGPMAHHAVETIASWRSPGEPTPDTPWPCAMIDVPAGPCLLGDPDSGAARYVQVPAFQIGRDPVTIAQYRQFDPGIDPRDQGATDDKDLDRPVVLVTWFDAWVCARWYACRLPLEAEWEKAASWDPQAQSRRPFPWGAGWQSGRCNSLEAWNENGHPTPVDRYAGMGESACGCRDMAGNVFEWLQDRGPEGSIERRVLKGGSWQSAAAFTRTDASIWLRPRYRGPGVGFRLARSMQKKG